MASRPLPAVPFLSSPFGPFAFHLSAWRGFPSFIRVVSFSCLKCAKACFLQKVRFCTLLGALSGIGGNPTFCIDECFYSLCSVSLWLELKFTTLGVRILDLCATSSGLLSSQKFQKKKKPLASKEKMKPDAFLGPNRADAPCFCTEKKGLRTHTTLR